jgi:hypothetical protein
MPTQQFLSRAALLIPACAIALALAVATSATAGTRTINFDDDVLAPCTFGETGPLTTRYTASMGVTFAGPAPGEGGAILDQCGGFGVTGHSPPKFLAFNLSSGYPKPPETITFAQPIHTFEIKAGQNGSGGTFTITGFDGTTPVSVNSRNSTQALSVLTLAATRMTSVKLEYTPGTVQYMIFDDMKFGTAPVSGNEGFEVIQNGRLDVPAAGVLANDSDADNDPLTAVLSRPANNGIVDLRPDGSFTYTPGPGFSGNDSFAYRANDGTGNGNEATVAIKVNPLPPPPPPPPPPERILGVTMPFAFSKSTKKFTVFTLLQIKGIPRGSTLKVTCKAPKGKKCPAKRFTKRNARGKVSLKKWIRKRLAAGTKLTASVTKPGNFIGAVKIMTVRKKKRPSFVDRCLPPGTTKPRRC